jgi:hypothetical protein
MKKIVALMSFIILVSLISFSYADNDKLSIDINKTKTNLYNKTEEVLSNFDNSYALDYNRDELTADEKFEAQFNLLSRKTTYLLLGNPNSDNDDYIEYSKRKKELFEFRYNPVIPRDAEGNFIKTSEEYKDDTASGINVPGMFKIFSEMNISYKGYADTKVFKTDKVVIVKTALTGVSIEIPNEKEPMKLDKVSTNLKLTYFYKLKGEEYKLYWIMAETADDITEYFDNIEKNENIKTGFHSIKFTSSNRGVYDYSKLDDLRASVIDDVYNKNVNNIVLLNTYYDKSIINVGVGFFISDGLIVTTWNYIEKSLMNGQFILIKDKDGNLYEYDGFVTADVDLDIAIIKLKNKVTGKVLLGDSKELEANDPVIAISTKGGFNLSVTSGIMISNDNTIKSVIPLSDSDEGSPLFNKNGEVIGINSTKSINTEISIASPSYYLKPLIAKLKSENFNEIEFVSFDELKSKYYYNKNNNEIEVNEVGTKIWNIFKDVGDIENTIFLPKIKTSYYNNVLSIRYKNEISDFISSESIARPFVSNLLEQGYKKIDKKNVYENNKYKVSIMYEFDYLIIIMVKK